MSQSTTKISQQLQELLTIQENFLALTHKQVYHANLPISEAILKFQINHISEINDKFNAAISSLSQQLFEKKKGYDGTLREQFQRLLEADYLPLLRINRYQITKLSLFGFDIYIEPLDAFLNILSKMDSLKQRLIKDGLKEDLGENAESSLEKGWDAYSTYSVHWKLSFNLYILKEYLMVGSKSFLRKDRQILFTGINNFYADLVPALSQINHKKLLLQLAELNNSLYYFHPSFSYFQFYTLLLPLRDQLEPIFAFMKEITEKCLRTNIITPLLFGILRNRQAFLRFIREADSPIWLPYINTIISGIAINLKFRILQYEEILEVYQQAVLKAGILGAIRTDEILGKLEQGWKDAKDFFISAVKIGFSSNEAEAWKCAEFQTIGPRVIGSLLDGMLLGIRQNSQNVSKYLQNAQQKLENAVKLISENKLDSYFIKTTICQLENNLSTNKHLYSLIQICNLIKLLGISNQYSLHFIVTCFNKINVKPRKMIALRLEQVASQINQLLFKLGTPNLTFLKQKIIQFNMKFPPKSHFPQLVDFYFSNFEPKKCLNQLLALRIQQKASQQFLLLVFEKFIPKPSNKHIILKTFDAQYTTNNSYINLPYESHCLLNFATSQLVNGNDSYFAEQMIKTLVKACPWVNFALLNFPVNNSGDLLSFSSWLIDNRNYHNFFKRLLQNTKNTILSQKGQDLIKILIYPSILDHLSKRINEVTQFKQLNGLCSLAMNIAVDIDASTQFSIDLLSILLHLLEKTDNASNISQIVKSIAILSQTAFKDKLHIWLLSLLQRRIEGRAQLSVGYRKRVLKTNHANIYFLGQIKEGPQWNKQPIQNRQQSQNTGWKQEQFQKTLKDIMKMTGHQYQLLNNIQNAVMLEQIKSFSVPKKEEKLLKEIFAKKQGLILNLLSLNFQNHSILIQQALQTKDTNYLKEQRFDKNLTKYVPRILQLHQTSDTSILGAMSEHLTLSERVTISQNFFLDQNIIPLYCNQAKGIEYLSVHNSNNWRTIIEYYTKIFSLSNVSSTILQYNEFLNITNQQNGQYEKIISKHAHIFKGFVSLFIYKLKSILSEQYSQQEVELRSINEVSSLNIIIASSQLKQVLTKLAHLNKALQERNILTLNEWIENVQTLNQSINGLYNGDILLSNFVFSFCFTNEYVCETLKTQIGLFIQKYREILDSKQAKSYYLPSNYKKVSIKELQQCKSSQIPQVLQKDIQPSLISQRYLQLVKSMQQKQLLNIEGKNIHLNLSKQPGNEEFRQFYLLGCYHARTQEKERYQLEKLLNSVSNREKLEWQLVKEINEEAFTHISQIITDAQIAKKNMPFSYNGQALIPNAEGIIVNEYNKIEYCNRIGLKIIGLSGLQCLKQFMRGYVYQNSQK